MTYPGKKGKNVQKGQHDRTRWGTRAEERTRKEVGLEKHTTREVRAGRSIQKEVRLENALPIVVEGSKVHSKGGRVRKRGEGSKAH